MGQNISQLRARKNEGEGTSTTKTMKDLAPVQISLPKIQRQSRFRGGARERLINNETLVIRRPKQVASREINANLSSPQQHRFQWPGSGIGLG